MNQMNIELSKMQLIHLRNICKKGWGGYSKPSDDLEEMVKNGLLTKSAGPFGDVVYRPTDAGRSYINDFNNVDDSSQYALSIEKPLKLPKGVTKKEIEVEFLQSTKSEEIIHKMYNAFEFQNDAVADASTFFRHVKDEDRYVELYNFIHE